MPLEDDAVDVLAGLALFADLSRPQLEAVAHTFEEEWFPQDQRVIRQGLGGNSVYVILEGDASVRVDGQEVARLSRGDLFGEVSVLLGEAPIADIVATTPLRVLVLPGAELERFLTEYPGVSFRMAQAQARRLRNAMQAQS